MPLSTEIISVSVDVIIKGDYCSYSCSFLDSSNDNSCYDLCDLFGVELKNQTEIENEILTNRCKKCKQGTHY